MSTCRWSEVQICSWISQCFHWKWRSLGCVHAVKPVLYQPTQTGCELWSADTLESCPITCACSRFYFEISQWKRGVLFFLLCCSSRSAAAARQPQRITARQELVRITLSSALLLFFTFNEPRTGEPLELFLSSCSKSIFLEPDKPNS